MCEANNAFGDSGISEWKNGLSSLLQSRMNKPKPYRAKMDTDPNVKLCTRMDTRCHVVRALTDMYRYRLSQNVDNICK